MIDLILWANTKATLATFAQTTGLMVDDGDGGRKVRDGVEWSWWAGSGKLMTAPAVLDQDGNVTTPATFLPGEVLLMRIHGSFAESDRLDPDEADPERAEPWRRSKVARFIRNNGTPGTIGTINYYQISGVRIFRSADVMAWLAANNLPGHEWLGGNAL